MLGLSRPASCVPQCRDGLCEGSGGHFPGRPAEKRGHGKTRRLSGKERFAVKEYTAYHVVTERPMTVGQVLCLDETLPQRRVPPGDGEGPLGGGNLPEPRCLGGETAGAPHDGGPAGAGSGTGAQGAVLIPPGSTACTFRKPGRRPSSGRRFLPAWAAPRTTSSSQVRGRKFVGNANLCFDATVNQEENRRLAQRYWSLALAAGQPPIWEIWRTGR